MSSTSSHDGPPPSELFIVVRKNNPHYWVYMKEGHAINRMLKERKEGGETTIVKYIPEVSDES